ncbi:uncharacterized protein LOC129599033 [Paramacrobiotus metropolitanus]|uniref:uncharacterized protein LOC129599033 n=1 Tax=Paramacrobiotus metropolitanus TaxID=2943436 RepID=UPI0024457F0D|nr:uncharacterized protein LOC129599033 [Paramacrobiotus metropolitanus]
MVFLVINGRKLLSDPRAEFAVQNVKFVKRVREKILLGKDDSVSLSASVVLSIQLGTLSTGVPYFTSDGSELIQPAPALDSIMHVYGVDDKAVYAWNAVDVLVDGQLQHGRVIEVAETGLLIDFGCDSQRAQLIDHGDIFHSVKPDYHVDARQDRRVEVLLRATPDAPWTWFAGTMDPGNHMSFCADSYIVDVRLPYGTFTELVPRQQVRRPPSNAELASRRVGAKAFEMRECSLPPENSLRLLLQRKHPVWCGTVNQGTLRLRYVQRARERPLQSRDLEAACMEAWKEHHKEMPRLLISALAEPPAKRQRTSSDSCDAELQLPCELMAEIFQSLDSIHRFRCRRVSALWNVLLTTETYFHDVHVSGRPEDYPASWATPGFWVLNTMLRCVDRRTETLILTHMNVRQCDCATAMIRNQMDGLRTLVFNRCVWLYPSFAVGLILRRRGTVRRVCGTAERVVWSHCRIEEPRLTAVIPRYSHTCQPKQLKMALWDLFEKHLVLEEPVDRSVLAEWIAQCVQHGQFGNLTTILYAYLHTDPRPSNPYRQCWWTATSVAGLQVTQLTPLAAAALRCAMEEEQW